MPYQRDRFSQWLRYFGSFLFFGPVDVPRYHLTHGKKKLASKFVIGELAWWTVALLLLLVNWKAAVTLFFIPVVLVRFLMMAGNWGQHAFVDRDDPENPYRNSITCINSRYNRRTFNDGYHIHHHVKARCHWADLPIEFHDNIEEYGRQDAIIFDGLDFFFVWVCLMLGWWKPLTDAFVILPGAPDRTEEEVRALFKQRLAAIPAGYEPQAPAPV